MKNSAKNKLKRYFNFKESDFYSENGVDYTISKDNYMEKASDVLEDLQSRYEDEE